MKVDKFVDMDNSEHDIRYHKSSGMFTCEFMGTSFEAPSKEELVGKLTATDEEAKSGSFEPVIQFCLPHYTQRLAMVEFERCFRREMKPGEFKYARWSDNRNGERVQIHESGDSRPYTVYKNGKPDTNHRFSSRATKAVYIPYDFDVFLKMDTLSRKVGAIDNLWLQLVNELGMEKIVDLLINGKLGAEHYPKLHDDILSTLKRAVAAKEKNKRESKGGSK